MDEFGLYEVEEKLEVSRDDYLSADMKVDSDACFKMHYGPITYRIGGFGQLGFIGGEQASMKSTLARELCRAALTGEEVLNYTLDIKGKSILYIDTENPRDHFKNNQIGMLNRCGLEDVPENYDCISLSKYPDPTVKFNKAMNAIRAKDNIGLVIIDVMADLVPDEGDTRVMNVFLADLISLAEELNCLILCISHVNDDGKLLGVGGRKLGRKSSFGFNLHKLGGSSLIRSGKTRYEPFPASQFFVEDGLPKPDIYVPFGIFKQDKTI